MPWRSCRTACTRAVEDRAVQPLGRRGPICRRDRCGFWGVRWRWPPRRSCLTARPCGSAWGAARSGLPTPGAPSGSRPAGGGAPRSAATTTASRPPPGAAIGCSATLTTADGFCTARLSDRAREGTATRCHGAREECATACLLTVLRPAGSQSPDEAQYIEQSSGHRQQHDEHQHSHIDGD